MKSKMLIILTCIIVLLIILLPGCNKLRYSKFNHDGQTRLYILYLPNDLPENAPLVFVLHGYGSNGLTIMNYVDMNSIADENGFAVCYPQGSSDFKGIPH